MRIKCKVIIYYFSEKYLYHNPCFASPVPSGEWITTVQVLFYPQEDILNIWPWLHYGVFSFTDSILRDQGITMNSFDCLLSFNVIVSDGFICQVEWSRCFSLETISYVRDVLYLTGMPTYIRWDINIILTITSYI